MEHCYIGRKNQNNNYEDLNESKWFLTGPFWFHLYSLSSINNEDFTVWIGVPGIKINKMYSSITGLWSHIVVLKVRSQCSSVYPLQYTLAI